MAAEDLSQLKYVVTTVGMQEAQTQCFDKALQETLLKIRGDDLEHVDNLAAAYELAEQVMARVRSGEEIRCTRFLQRLLRRFGLLSQGDVTFDHVRRFVDGIHPHDEQVKALKLGVERAIQELTRRVDYGSAEVLN